MRYVGRAVWAAILGAVLGLAPLCSADSSAYDLYRQGRREERAGHIVQAYLLYSQASGLQPENKEYWRRSQALRSRAAMAAQPGPASAETEAEEAPAPTGPLPVFNIEDERDLKDFQPPRDLILPPGEKDYDFKGANRQLWEKAAQALKMDVVFDRDYDANGQPNRVRLDQVSAAVLLRSLSAVTSSFVLPMGDRLFLVAQDTPQKRQELEQVMSISMPIPDVVSVQEAQELGKSIQGTLEIQKFAIDGVRREILVRDRVSKVRSAQILLNQLMHPQAQVALDLEFLEVSKTSSLNVGITLPNSFTLIDFAKVLGSVAAVPTGFSTFLTFGGGKSFLGLGVTNASVIAQASKGDSRLILRSEIRSLDGQPATFNVGERYPIITQGYYGQTSGTGTVYTPPPTFNFENLGLTLKVTPHVHGMDEMSLDVESDFRVLGSASVNNIPIISERKYNATVSLREGEWAVVAGLMTSQQAKTLSGIAGLSRIPIIGPLTSMNTRDKSETGLLLLIKPRLISLPPSETATRAYYTGTETRPVSPL